MLLNNNGRLFTIANVEYHTVTFNLWKVLLAWFGMSNSADQKKLLFLGTRVQMTTAVRIMCTFCVDICNTQNIFHFFVTRIETTAAITTDKNIVFNLTLNVVSDSLSTCRSLLFHQPSTKTLTTNSWRIRIHIRWVRVWSAYPVGLLDTQNMVHKL